MGIIRVTCRRGPDEHLHMQSSARQDSGATCGSRAQQQTVNEQWMVGDVCKRQTCSALQRPECATKSHLCKRTSGLLLQNGLHGR